MKLSLNSKINIIITFVILTAMLSFGSYTVFQERAAHERELYNTLDEITKRLSISLSESVWNIDNRLIVATVNSEKTKRDLYSVVIRENYENAVIYSTVRDESWRFVDGYENGLRDDNISKVSEIVKNDEKIGEVEVVVSKRFLTENVLEQLNAVVVPLTVVLLILVFVIGGAMRFLVIKPLADLSRVSRTIAMGDLDYPIESNRDDEIGYLAGSFAKMRNSVKDKIDNLNVAQTQIKESNNRFATVMDSVDALVFVTDMDRNEVLFINDYGRDNWRGNVGMKCRDLLHPNSDGTCPVCTKFHGNDNVEAPSSTRVWEHLSENDNRWYEFRDRAITWPDGRVVKLTIATDISERKEAQNSINESEAKFRMISEQSKMGIFITQNAAFKYCNKAFADIVKYEVDDILKFSPGEYAKLVHKEDLEFVKRQSEMREHGHEEDVSNYYCRLVTSSGEARWVNVFARPVPYEGGDADLVTVFDVTDEKIHEIERERLMKFIESKNEELESVVYVASHDLRTPLVNIQGFVTELSRSVDDLLSFAKGKVAESDLKTFDEIQKDIGVSRDYIFNNVEKQSELLVSLVKVSRLGRRKVVRTVEDTTSIVKSIVDSMAYEIQQNNIDVQVGPLPDFYGDRVIISQVFSNLIANSIKYRSDRPCVIKISGEKRLGFTEYCIEDNGIGIKDKALSNIFKLFYRIDEKIPGGDGIGLSIVKRGVMMNGGKVRVESKFGEWSKFYISLPDKENSFPI